MSRAKLDEHDAVRNEPGDSFAADDTTDISEKTARDAGRDEEKADNVMQRTKTATSVVDEPPDGGYGWVVCE